MDDYPTNNVDEAYAIITEIDGRQVICRCPGTWNEDGEGASAVYDNPVAALRAFNAYRDKHPDAYYGVVEVKAVMDTDLLQRDPSVAALLSLTTMAIDGDGVAGDLALALLGDDVSLAGTS